MGSDDDHDDADGDKHKWNRYHIDADNEEIKAEPLVPGRPFADMGSPVKQAAPKGHLSWSLGPIKCTDFSEVFI